MLTKTEMVTLAGKNTMQLTKKVKIKMMKPIMENLARVIETVEEADAAKLLSMKCQTSQPNSNAYLQFCVVRALNKMK